MIHKSNLKGKYIDFLDKDGKHRTQQVTRVKGNFLTVKDVLGIINKINKDRVKGRRFRKRGLEPIDWTRGRNK